MKKRSLFEPFFLRLIFGIFTLALVVIWHHVDSEAEPWSILPGKQESTRFTTLRKIADSANKGYYFQLEPGIPMEHEWEDVGLYFWMVSWGIVKHHVGLGPLDPWTDPYGVELAMVFLPLFLIFFTRLFSLPRWYWLVPPVFFAWATVLKYPLGWENIHKLNGLLYWSISTRWSKVLSGFWTFTVALQFFEWWRQGTLIQWNKRKIFRLFVMGFVLGIFVSVRKDIWVTSGLALTSSLFLLCFVAHPFPGAAPVKSSPAKRGLAMALMLGVLFGGSMLNKGVVCLAWTIRDHCYPMKLVSRFYGRNTWHSMCASLGVLPNNYGLVWGDAEVSDVIKGLPENKGLVYGTPEYEKASRRFYFQLIRKDPGLLIRNLKHRANQVWVDHHNGMMRAFFAILAMLFLGIYHRWLGILLLSNILTNTVILILVNHWIHYGLDFVTHYRLALLIGLGACAHKAWQILFARGSSQAS